MNLSPIRKVYQGIADRRQMFRMFDRHAQRPNRWEGDDSALYRGEWFEIGEAEHDYCSRSCRRFGYAARCSPCANS